MCVCVYVILLICTVQVNSITFHADTNECNYVNILIIVGPVNKSTGKNLFETSDLKMICGKVYIMLGLCHSGLT